MGDLNKVIIVMKKLYKYAIIIFKKRLLNFYNLLFQDNKIPDDFRKALGTALFKKGDMSKTENYSAISLWIGYKILARFVVANLMNPTGNTFLLEPKYEFRSNRSCTDTA